MKGSKKLLNEFRRLSGLPLIEESETNESIKGINNQKAVKQAFDDMKDDIEAKRKEDNQRLNPFGSKGDKMIHLDDDEYGGYTLGWDTEVKDYGDSWVAGKSHVYNKDTRRLNKTLEESLRLVLESKATEQQAMNILTKGGAESPEEILNDLKKIDMSQNQKNLPAMAYLKVKGNAQDNDLKSVFDDYNGLVNKKRVKPVQATKKGLMMGDKVFPDFIKFSEYIHGEKNKYAKKEPAKGGEVSTEEGEDKPIWSGNGIDIFDGVDVGRCIKYTQGGLTGRGYSFCIGQPGNTMYQSYRDSKGSSFYYIVDTNRDGSDPLHIVVFDNTQYGVELTDANNTTGTIAEFGQDVDGYLDYLKSKGVPVEKLEHKPKTPEEEEEQKKLGKQNTSLDWFKSLSYDEKSKYIGRGHQLTNDQFDYLLGEE